MSRKLIPTGNCWCGCGTSIDLGSFFAPGHDKRAEAKVIMEVFGGVPQFIAAFGYAPSSDGRVSTTSWVDNAMRLKGIAPPERQLIRMEYPDPDGTGRLVRTKKDVHLSPIALEDGAATFTVHDRSVGSISIPFIDLVAVYKGESRWIVRIAGTFEDRGQYAEYVPLARDELGKVTQATLRLMELGPLKEAAMATWKRLGVDGVPALWVTSEASVETGPKEGFARWRDLDAAIAALSVDDAVLQERCDQLTKRLAAADGYWFEARRFLMNTSPKPSADMVHWKFLRTTWSEGKGEKLVEDVRDAYVKLLRHLDTLVR